MPLCMGCLNEIPAAGAVCEVCSFDNSKEQTAPYLPFGTVLNNKYVVARNLETNGESTRYLGYDKTNGKVISLSPLQSENAPSPILITLSGTVTLLSKVQLKNA